MIHARLVARKVRQTFEAINAGHTQAMVDSLADEFSYHFHGRHALGGRRHSRASMQAWWQRVGRLLPGARFEVEDVLVAGGPWHTRVAVRARISGDLPDGSRYDNTVMQWMTLRWGKVVQVQTLEDLQVLDHALQVMAAHGAAEALAEPIEDPQPQAARPSPYP